MFECCICHKGPLPEQGGVSVYRINAKGVAGVYACKRHVTQTDARPINPEVREIVELIGEA